MATLPAGWELDERDEELLRLACRQVDDVDRLERLISKYGPMVKGSQGQPVLNPALAEARQGRLAVNRLLGELALPDESGDDVKTQAQKRGERAARARWDRHERQREDHRAEA